MYTYPLRTFATLLFTFFQIVLADAASGPVCPAEGRNPYPGYAAAGAEPRTAIWKDIRLATESGCGGISKTAVKLVISLAGNFRFHGSVETMARRIGAISTTKGMRYWSVTDGRMRVLVDESFALSDAAPSARRGDFRADEILTGTQLFFAQDDTRSTGLNIYSLKTVSADANNVIFDVVNETPIKIGLITLFAARAVRSRHFFSRVSGDLWSYYGLTAIQAGQTIGAEKSLINRGIALYKHLTH